LKPTHEISGDSSTKRVANYGNDMRNGNFDWSKSPISVVRHEGNIYVVDEHHRLAAAKWAGVHSVAIHDVTEELLKNGLKGYKDMDDVLSSAGSFISNRLNPYKLKRR
jgi:hypothetical protein